MKAGIVGLPNVGKSTLFNALTNVDVAASNYPFCTIEPNVGVVSIPDPRLETINRFIETKSVSPAILQLVDIAGLVRGAHKGEGLGNQFLSHIREVDAVLHVVRCFSDVEVTHVDGDMDPIRDIETIETELLLSDLQRVEQLMIRAKKNARLADRETAMRVEVLERCAESLGRGEPLLDSNWETAYQQIFRGLGLLSSKPVLYIANVDEQSSPETEAHLHNVRAHAKARNNTVLSVCAHIEAELAELDPADRLELLDSMNMDEPALAKVARVAYALLGLQSFFTAGEKQIKAWTVPVGSTAPQAAGVIHSDFERGFIRVEVYQIADLEAYESESRIKAAGKMRLEGKSYLMQDGDICHFLFNV